MAMNKSFWGIAAAALLAACQGETGGTGATGPTGPGGPGYVALEPAGVVGVVTDAGNNVVGGGKVYFVPASAVAAMGPTTTAFDSTTDEPLEDLITQNGATYPSDDVGSDGVYRLPTLATGSYYVTFVPATGAPYLPGGSLCRVARGSDALVGTRLDIEVSGAIPADARFVGSARCVTCHGRTHISQTMHRLGIWSTYQTGALQDLEARRADLYQAVDSKFTVAGTTVYFYDYDATRGFDKYKTLETDPGAGVSFTVKVSKDGSGNLFFTLHNVKNPADPDVVLPVDAIYGGGVMKQRFMTKLSPATGSYYALLPLQFQNEGSDAYPDRAAKVWRDYNSFKWYDETTTTFKKPAAKDSFEKNCVSCHAVGVKVTGTDATTYVADTVEDAAYGDFDFDGNGVREEMNVGCESCHGPGSRHWEAAGQGKHIVSLKLLTPEREAMVCGQCHSRPKGALNTDSPVNADGLMMIAGTSRPDFLQNHATSQDDGAASDFWTDAGSHSKSHHQQYTDFIRSGMYKNAVQLMTCSSCHDPHQKTANPRQLRASPTQNAALCGSCHATQAGDLAVHLTAKGIPLASTKAGLALCTDCHMPKTAKTGSGEPGVLGTSGTQYWRNDISSHLFDVPAKAASIATKMPTAFTNPCGSCHAGSL
jgi:predicted CXXCH cytochrome family protein